MKKLAKLLAVLLAATLLMSLVACSPGAGSTPTPGAGSTPTPDGGDETVYTVGICQLLTHEALDAATAGFMDALTELLGEENVVFDLQIAGESPVCTTIANKFVTDGVDLIMANATPALQAAAAATGTIPVVGTSITDYISAGVLKGDSENPGGNVTGASDLAPIDQQVELLLELCPDAETVGILYCSAEANSVFQADKAKGYLEAAGKTVNIYTTADSSDIQAVVTQLVGEVDALYIPTDNTVADNIELVKNITVPAKLPVICGEENMCKKGGLATLSISYYDMGRAAGELAYEILIGEKDPATSPIVYVAEVTRKYNPEVAELIGWTIPEGIAPIE